MQFEGAFYGPEKNKWVNFIELGCIDRIAEYNINEVMKMKRATSETEHEIESLNECVVDELNDVIEVVNKNSVTL